MNSLVKNLCVCEACGVYFNIVNYMVAWTLLGPMFTLHATVLHSEIERSAHNGFVCFMWFPERLFSYTERFFFYNLSRVCLLLGTN